MSIRPLFLQHDQSSEAESKQLHSARMGDPRAVQAKVTALPDDRLSGARIWCVAWVVIAIVALMASRVSAQQANFPYDSIPMNPKLEDPAVVKNVEAITKSFATTGTGDPRMANGYFTLYVPAKMTAPDGIKHISQIVTDTNTLLARAQRSNKPQVAQQMTRFVFDGMKKVAEGNFHPAARINATTILSRLDGRVADPATRTPPVPLRETLPILMALYADENNVDGVRAAALHGLHRHVMFGFPQMTPAERTSISGMMTALLDSPAPSGRPADAHAYLQRFAVDILDVLRTKEDKSLGSKLISISTEPTSPDLIALYSASRLATMGTELQGQVPAPKQVLDSWSKRVLDAFEGELARLDAKDNRIPPDRTQPVKPESLLEKKTTETPKRTAASMMDSSGMDGEMEMSQMVDRMGEADSSMMESESMDMGLMMDRMGMTAMAAEKPQPPEVIATRKRLNSILQQVQLGVTGQPVAGLPKTAGGILASVSAQDKPVVEEWVTQMEGVITALNDKTQDDLKKFRVALVAQIDILRGIAGVPEDAAEAIDAELPQELMPADPLGDLAPAAAVAPRPAAAAASTVNAAASPAAAPQ
jgi:hypothetical protein